MKKTVRTLLILLSAALLVQGCSLFKKSCDCPSFGGSGHTRHRGPGW